MVRCFYLFNRHLDLGQPIGFVLIVPRPVYVAETRIAHDAHLMLLDVLHHLDHGFGEGRVGASVWIAKRSLDGRCLIEAQQRCVFVHLAYRLAIFYVDVLLLVLLVVLNCLTILWFGAGATHTHHLWADHVDAKRS